MILPPVHSTPQILLRFSSKATPKLISAIQKHLESNQIKTLSIEYEHEDGSMSSAPSPGSSTGSATLVTPEGVDKSNGIKATVVSITTTQEELEEQAEKVNLMKMTTANRTFGNVSIRDQFTVERRSRFIHPVDESNDDPKTRGGLVEDSNPVEFSSGERIELTFHTLENVTVLNIGEASNDLSRELDEMKLDYIDTSSRGTSITSVNESCTLVEVLQKYELIENITPVHFIAEREEILRDIFSLFTPLPIHKIRQYYGNEVAFYFAWLNCFTRWLIIPGIGGIVVNIIRKLQGHSVDACELIPFFGMGVFIWATLFMRFWEREESRLSYEWGAYTSNDRRQFQVRPAFKGVIRISPVTGLPEKYYSPVARRFKYLFSAAVTGVMLCVAFTIMIISLNLQGYVHPDDDERWSHETHPYYYPRIAHLAEAGQLFDANSTYMSLVPAILHAVTIQHLNAFYRNVAEKITEWENHKTFVAHENSLILKRFLFEAFDCYIALFYLAFFERDIKKLRGELIMVFAIDTFRRMLLECIIPYVQRRLSEKSAKDDKKKNDDWFDPTGNETKQESMRLVNESKLEKYEEFDDYLEMVIEFGYITLFASAIPLASSIAVLANIVEMWTDATKLARVLGRPRFVMTDSIGTWKQLINAIVILSALTNCFIFGLTSQQLMQFMPGLYYVDDSGETQWVRGKGYLVIIVIFGVERFLLFMNILINASIPKVPEDVLEQVERSEFIKSEESKYNRAERIRIMRKNNAKEEVELDGQ